MRWRRAVRSRRTTELSSYAVTPCHLPPAPAACRLPPAPLRHRVRLPATLPPLSSEAVPRTPARGLAGVGLTVPHKRTDRTISCFTEPQQTVASPHFLLSFSGQLVPRNDRSERNTWGWPVPLR